MVRMLADEARTGGLCDMVARCMARILGQDMQQPRVEIVLSRPRTAFPSVPFAVAITSFKVGCNGMRIFNRFG